MSKGGKEESSAFFMSIVFHCHRDSASTVRRRTNIGEKSDETKKNSKWRNRKRPSLKKWTHQTHPFF